MIDLEDIKPQTLPYQFLSRRKNLPEVSAIYFVISGQDVVHYIGQTVNLRVRWQKHHRFNQFKKYPDCKIVWLEVSNSELLPLVEEALIKRFQPPLNGTSVKEKGILGVKEILQTAAQLTRTELEELSEALTALLEALDDGTETEADLKQEPRTGPRGGSRIEWKLINGYGPYPYLRFRKDGKYRSYYLKDLAAAVRNQSSEDLL